MPQQRRPVVIVSRRDVVLARRLTKYRGEVKPPADVVTRDFEALLVSPAFIVLMLGKPVKGALSAKQAAWLRKQLLTLPPARRLAVLKKLARLLAPPLRQILPIRPIAVPPGVDFDKSVEFAKAGPEHYVEEVEGEDQAKPAKRARRIKPIKRAKREKPATAVKAVPRYACVQAFHEEVTGERGDELTNKEPFRSDTWYQLDVSVRVDPKGIPARKRRETFDVPQQTTTVDILVVAESDDFDIAEQTRKITLPPTGDSLDPAASFRARPKRHSQSDADALTIQFALYYELNLLQIITVRGEAIPKLSQVSPAKYAKKPPITLDYERKQQSNLDDLDLMAPCRMHVRVESRGAGGFKLTFTLKKPRSGDVSLPASVTLTSAQLGPAIAGVRKSLFQICSSDPLSKGLDPGESDYADQLSTLSDRGANLWTLLFDSAPDTAMGTIGALLKKNPLPMGSKIQISLEDGIASFVFAWGLLYDRPATKTDDRQYEGFWGMRYVIEQRPLSVVVPIAVAAPSLDTEIGAMFWRFDQTPGQIQFLNDLTAQTVPRATLRLANGGPIDRANPATDCLKAGTSQVLYFYTHGYQALPDGESFGVTVADFIRLYDSLPTSSPLRDQWESLYTDIQKKQFVSDQSWIELTYGQLALNPLYQSIQQLPARPLVILNMCDSAQITPSLSQSFIHFFLTRGARAVIGTECPMLPFFADFLGKRLLQEILSGQPMGNALRKIRVEAAKQRNLLGLAYTLFGTADAALAGPVIR